MRRLLSVLIFCCAVTFSALAQFSENDNIVGGPPGAGATSNINPESDVVSDTTTGFSVSAMVKGLLRKQELKTTYTLVSNAVLPGVMQIYNKDYWKLPIIYGGIGTGLYYGIHNNNLYKETGEKKYATTSALAFAGAATMYWGTLIDGVMNFPDQRTPDPTKAAIYSALIPGMGQAYNGDWWHIPIWYGGFIVCAYTYAINDSQYNRFKYIYNISSDEESGYIGHITSEQAKWYRDVYRRYRDYSIVAAIVVYALNIIDANVFAYMSDFNVNDDLTFNVQPSIISPISNDMYASGNFHQSYGFKMNLTF